MYSKDPKTLMGSDERGLLVIRQSLELKDESQFDSFEYQMKTADTERYHLTSILSRWITEWVHWRVLLI